MGFDVVVPERGGNDEPGPEVIDVRGHVGFFVTRGVRGQPRDMSIAMVLAVSALCVLLVGGSLFVRNAQRGTVRKNPADILGTGYAALTLALAAVALGFQSGSLAPVLGAAALPLAFSPVLLFVMHRRRTPLGEIRFQEGDCLPAFEAQHVDGSPFASTELRHQRVLLKFYRGHWCPFCSTELRQLEALRPQLEARGIQVIALSKDTPTDARYHRERDGLGFTLLCDPELKAIRPLGLEHRKALELSGGRLHVFGFPLGYRPRFESMAIPTTVLLDENGRVRFLDQSDDYQVRTDPERLRAALDHAFGPAPLRPDGSLPALPAGTELAPCA